MLSRKVLPHIHFPSQQQMPFDKSTTPFQHPSLANNTQDPASVDFRAFYPYTPNEVKHRKRTTSAQLQVLECVFRRDTKPNASLRHDLAQELEMTPRGVQVWFQNRRAKEKTKASKVLIRSTSTTKPTNEGTDDDTESPQADDISSASPSVDAHSPMDSPPSQVDASSQGQLSPLTSPPQLHVITDTANVVWQNSPVEQPPDSGTYISRSNLFSGTDSYALRRGSLPVNAFPHPDSSKDGPPVIDCFDPSVRRRSVDASLQRLAFNPYAPYARAKNDILFGPRVGVAPPGRHHQLSRIPYFHNQSHRPSLPHHPSMPQRFGARRSSVCSRTFRFASQPTISPSPPPLLPHDVRGSLPDPYQMYTMPTRVSVSPIPGPLPSPDYSFGAASTPSMTSPSSADSERNSPDSVRSFTYRNEDFEDEERFARYDAFSRYGSIASIASESSINSSYYPEIGGPRADHELVHELPTDTRLNSCTPSQYVGMVSTLNVNPQDLSSESIASTPDLISYSPHQDFTAESTVGGAAITHPVHEPVPSYPTPTSVVDSNTHSPHGQENLPSGMPISRSSELTFALQSKFDQAQCVQESHLTYAQQESSCSSATQHSVPEPDAFFYGQRTDHGHSVHIDSSPAALNYKYPPSNFITPQEQYAPSFDMVNGYVSETAVDLGLHQIDYHGRCGSISDVYSAYGESGSLENTVHGVEVFSYAS